MLQRLSNSLVFNLILAILGLSFILLLGIQLSNEVPALIHVNSLALIKPFDGFSYWTKFILGIAALGLIYFLMKRINSEHRFIDGGTIPLISFYLLFISFSTQSIIQLDVVISSLLCTSMLWFAMKIYNQNNVMSLVFWCATFVGLASIIYLPSILMILVLFLTIAVFRSFNIREYLIAMVGVLLPFLYSYAIAYLMGNNLGALQPSTGLFSFVKLGDISLHLIGVYGIILLLIWAVFTGLASRSKLIVRQRNQLWMILAFVFVGSLNLFLFPALYTIPFIAAPLALLFHISYQNFRMKWIIDILLLVLFSISLLDKINPL